MGEFRVTINPKNKPATPEVNWQQARVLEMQAEYAAAFDTQAGTYGEMRAAYRKERKMWNSGGPEMAETIDFEIPFGEDKVPARLLRPVKAEKLPVIFFMHGGGFVLGDNDTHNLVQRKLAAYSGCVVVGIEYTLSPEVVYPRAIEECTTACKYVLEHAEEYGIDPEKFGFAGDSGGANLSMGVTMHLRDDGFDISRIKGNILFYGSYGMKASVIRNLHGGSWDGMSEEDLAFYLEIYLGEGVDPIDCPYFDTFINDLTHDVPPCFIVSAELDPLRDDSKLLYEILTNNGIQAEYHEYKGALHAFIHYSKVMDDAEDALRRGAHFFAHNCGLDPRN